MASTDLVVVLPGIMGSTLYDQDDRPVWAASAGALLRAVGTMGGTVRRLRLPDGLGDEHPGDGVVPQGLMRDVHALPGIWTPIKGYDRLVARLDRMGFHEASTAPGAPPGNLLLVPYDWRLSNRYNGSRLAGLVEDALERWRAQGGPYTDARVVFVCHSMGGLVARWYVERCGGAEITRKLVTLGTPYRGAAKALDQLVNGVHPRLGPVGLDLTALARSMPSMYQLLPEYACIETADGLAKTTEIDVPELTSELVRDAMRFHTDLQAAEAARPDSVEMTHAIVGVRQPTRTSIRFDSACRAVALDTLDGVDHYGDATVPLGAGVGYALTMDTNRIHHVAEQHGNLQRNEAALDELEAAITAEPVRWRAGEAVTLRVTAPDLAILGERVELAVDIDDDTNHAIRVRVTDDTGTELDSRVPRVIGRHARAVFDGLPPGAHTIDVTGVTPGSPVAPVSTVLLVAAPST
jgi:pimeloyl-ACP methyl ester carboxylesterase